MATAKKKPSSKSTTPEPMDPGARETATPVATTNRRRNAYALDTLVGEVDTLYPDIPIEVSNVDGRGTALDVQFALTEEHSGLMDLLRLVQSDNRVKEVLVEEDDMLVLVSFRSDPRTQDSREPFHLADAIDVLIDIQESTGDIDGGDAFSTSEDSLDGGSA